MSGEDGLVVLVHPDAGLRRAWIEASEGGRFHVVGVGSAELALELLDDERCRVICVATTLGERLAQSLLRAARERRPDVSRVLVVPEHAATEPEDVLREGLANAVVVDVPRRARSLAVIGWCLPEPERDEEVLAALELDHPGLSKVSRDGDGAYRLEELRAAVVIDRLIRASERLRSTLPPADGPQDGAGGGEG